jgi:gamma-tubulin complex component 3
VLNEHAVNKYLRIFNFLWRLKRVEKSLAATWLRHMTSQVKQLSRGGGGVVGTAVFRQCNVLRDEMNHFVTNLHSYLMFEVLEAAWHWLEEKLNTGGGGDLDALVAAHETYLQQIVDKAMMGRASRALLAHLLKIFDLILRFGYVQERLHNAVLAEAERRIADGDDSGDEATRRLSRQFAGQVALMEQQYHELLSSFLDALSQPSSLDLEFLRFRLDFNEFYSHRAAAVHATGGGAARGSSVDGGGGDAGDGVQSRGGRGASGGAAAGGGAGGIDGLDYSRISHAAAAAGDTGESFSFLPPTL